MHAAAEARDARVTRANIDKAKALLGWEPRVSFEDGLRRFAAWRVAEEARRSALC